ncbi:uncharacterized protein LOC109861447 isoform X1 [Pseudomyrmex gracilis]|uniref:uncharacterized protein LOC109861447 isoform X1 n=1 Tax=Pseudomyrmex gracilis TaxID=219809 RepID=UPI0009955656|nr:uncharacterized protein LOC109861447 isoform X1 [Pseudomyrmex gracilis]
MHNCKPESFKKTKQSVLCSKHFLKSDYLVTTSSRMLKISACPSVFLCEPNAPKRRNRQPKFSSETPESHRLHYILPKVKINELEDKKVMATVQEEENKKNACTGCLTLEKKIQTLEEKIANVEKLFQLQSCNTRDISSPRQEELLQGSSTPTTTTRNARHDHCYISSPRYLRRKLDFTRSQKIMIGKIARSTMKKYRRATIKVSQLKSLLKIMKEKMIAKPKVVDHLEQVFGGSPLQLYERCVQMHATGGKRVTRKYSSTLRAFALTLHFYSPRAYESKSRCSDT